MFSHLSQKNKDLLDPNFRLKRSDYGLPEDKFLFACFNQLYKMDPEIFTTWYIMWYLLAPFMGMNAYQPVK